MIANALRAKGARVVRPLDFFRAAVPVDAEAGDGAARAPAAAAAVHQRDMEERVRAFFRRGRSAD
jgi:hypothetical protein